jgi:filamentous hemagglutinin family protein
MILASDVALATPGSTELPTGGTVVGGSATIASSGARLDINQTSGRAAIDWNTFNIGSDAHVHFQQPAGGVALNRVLASDASQIYGRLTSTGQVFLLNPQGIYFAPGAQVDVGGLVASTLNLSNANFMAGNYAFQGGSSNAIINQGNITAASGGTLALIAAKITNDGTLTAPGGNVLLGAGSKVTLDMGGPVKLQIENSALETLIANGGAIRAEGGTIGSPRKRPPPWPAA